MPGNPSPPQHGCLQVRWLSGVFALCARRMNPKKSNHCEHTHNGADPTRDPLSMQNCHCQAVVVMRVLSVWRQHINLQVV
jgi:hypothetical protein